jgi:hypothetical protein
MFRAINRSGEYAGGWANKNDLLYSIQKGWSSYFLEGFREGVDDIYARNSYLHNFCHHWGEYRTNWDRKWNPGTESFYHIRRKEYPEMMIMDVYGRIVNLRDLALDAWVTETTRPVYKRRYYHSRWEKYWALRNKRFRHPHLSTYYRQKSTQQERRISCDEMHKPYIRGKRNRHYLDQWNIESCIHSQITWKQVRVKKQWMVKQKENKILDIQD